MEWNQLCPHPSLGHHVLLHISPSNQPRPAWDWEGWQSMRWKTGRTKLPSNNEWDCQGVGIFFSEPRVEVRLFHLQINKWINKIGWTFQEFDIILVGNRKSQNSRKPQLLENSPCDLLFSYLDILQITKIFNMYFCHCHPGWLCYLNRW